MSPCQRVQYYRARLREIGSVENNCNSLLAQALRTLIAENLKVCRDESSKVQRDN
jgi:hypothetical protein